MKQKKMQYKMMKASKDIVLNKTMSSGSNYHLINVMSRHLKDVVFWFFHTMGKPED
jgi:hypothetical protein